MKKILKFTFLLLISNLSFSQIELDKSISYNDAEGWLLPYSTSEGSFYYLAGPGLKTFKIFNSDYSLKSEFTPNLPSGVETFDISLYTENFGVSKHIFNSDDLFEIVISFSEDEDSSSKKIIIYNENGEIVKDFGDNEFYISDIYDFIIFNDKAENVNKLIIYNTTTESTEIYTLPSSTLATKEIDYVKSLKSFPNPAINYLYIENVNTNQSNLTLFDVNGKEFTTKLIKTRQENSFKINLENLATGLYFYEIDNIKHKFIKK
ncbi:T9SS type A sorting domain-containing protein [Polaribacter sp. Asnod6-C07]|uniref:T9SS type A sorting domain-containing protein n=1 Tax=Polaribacter sp. Asnod6-C07 TaxID=3160582 RepID=UPI00386B5332